MCFVLYCAADSPISEIPWDAGQRAFHVRELDERELPVTRHLQRRWRKYLGSHLQCGCGFGHVMYQQGGWPEELMEPGEADAEQVLTHQQLHDFLAALLVPNAAVELYGCWDGEFAEPSGGHTTIPLAMLLSPAFRFRERYHYTVVKG